MESNISQVSRGARANLGYSSLQRFRTTSSRMDSFNGPFLVPLTPRARRSHGHPQRQCFNSHPARRPDAMHVVVCKPNQRAHVSILTRPEGRMQCWGLRWPGRALRGFQSSPGQKAGCNRPCVTIEILESNVSILTRPEGRMQLTAVGPSV